MTTPTPSPDAVLFSAVKDLAARSAHTFWQAAAGSAATLYAGSGLDVHELLSISGSEKLIVTVVGGAAAAGLSAVKSLVKTYVSTRKSTLEAEAAAVAREQLSKLPKGAQQVVVTAVDAIK